MKKIFKYKLEIKDESMVPMPIGAKILSVQTQNEKPCIWAQVDTDEQTEVVRHFRIFGTGHAIKDEIIDNCKFVGTVLIFNGRLVFHVYEELVD